MLEQHQTIFLRSSILKRSKQTLVPAAIVNFFSSSQRIALIHYFPLEVNGGIFLSLLVAFRNTATRRDSEIKRNRSRTKQEFSGEAFSKQNIKASLASLPFDSSRAPTAIFAFGVFSSYFSNSKKLNRKCKSNPFRKKQTSYQRMFSRSHRKFV